MLMHLDIAPVLKCNGHGLESWLVGHLREKQCILKGETQHVNVYDSVQYGKMHTGAANFF